MKDIIIFIIIPVLTSIITTLIYYDIKSKLYFKKILEKKYGYKIKYKDIK